MNITDFKEWFREQKRKRFYVTTRGLVITDSWNRILYFRNREKYRVTNYRMIHKRDMGRFDPHGMPYGLQEDAEREWLKERKRERVPAFSTAIMEGSYKDGKREVTTGMRARVLF